MIIFDANGIRLNLQFQVTRRLWSPYLLLLEKISSNFKNLKLKVYTFKKFYWTSSFFLFKITVSKVNSFLHAFGENRRKINILSLVFRIIWPAAPPLNLSRLVLAANVLRPGFIYHPFITWVALIWYFEFSLLLVCVNFKVLLCRQLNW